MEAPDPRAGPRAFELARAHQVHRRQPAGARRQHGRRSAARCCTIFAAAWAWWRAAPTRCIALCSRTGCWRSCRRRSCKPVPLGPLLERVVLLEQRLPVQLDPGPPATLNADPDQLEQMFINLLANAVDASLANGARPVRRTWRVADSPRLGDHRRPRPGHRQRRESVRAVLHHQARRQRRGPGPGAADRPRARRRNQPAESRRRRKARAPPSACRWP